MRRGLERAVTRHCPRCGDDVCLVRALLGPAFKGGKCEVWLHVVTGSSLCVDQLELDPNTGELVDARGR